MDANVIDPFITGLSDVLRQMTDLDYDIEEPYLMTDDDRQRRVTGFIDLSASQMKGSLAIGFDKVVALNIYNHILEEDIETIDFRVEDCVGEITNMVCGTAKSLLSAQGFQFDLTTPKVIISESEPVPHVQKEPIVIVPFTSEHGSFQLEIALPAKLVA